MTSYLVVHSYSKFCYVQYLNFFLFLELFIQCEKGNIHDWWTTKSKTVFHEKTDCVEHYYGNTTWEIQGVNITVNGKWSLNENIADLGGGSQTYEAYGKNNFVQYLRLLKVDNYSLVQINIDIDCDF